MLRQLAVTCLVCLVQDEVDQVEAGEEGGGQLDVVHHGHVGVVAGPDGVGGGEHGGAGVEGGDDARLGHRHRLLLHHLVQHGARVVAHLVELVDAADALVAEHQRAALQHHLARLGVLGHVRRQAHRRRPTAGGVDAAGGDLVHVGEQLRLGHARVAHQQAVDLAAELAVLPRAVLVGAAEQEAQDALLDVLHLPDGGRHAVHQPPVHVRMPRDLRELRHLLLREPRHLVALLVLLGSLLIGRLVLEAPGGVLAHVNHVQICLVHALQRPPVGGGLDRHRAVDAGHLHAVARLGVVHHRVEEAQVHRVRRLALRHRVRRLLHLNLLAVGEGAAVVHELHAELGGALGARALHGLLDAAAVHVLRLRVVAAHQALEERRLQVGDDAAHARRHAAHRHHRVDVRGVQVPHVLRRQQVVRANRDLHLLRLIAHRLPQHGVALVVDDDVEDGDDFLGVGHQLLVEIGVVRVQVLAVQIDDGRLLLQNLLKHRDVICNLSHAVLLFEVADKSAEALATIVHIDCCAPHVRLLHL
mmetsp:Transcript_9575/g.19836  ORF Transcript_9575/g.19836 Transcript_9575/m.19836 type:complete len:529 (+) Transcript_9575:859-2445(+)